MVFMYIALALSFSSGALCDLVTRKLLNILTGSGSREGLAAIGGELPKELVYAKQKRKCRYVRTERCFERGWTFSSEANGARLCSDEGELARITLLTMRTLDIDASASSWAD